MSSYDTSGKYYDIAPLYNEGAEITVAFGERSAGKSTSTHTQLIKNVVNSEYELQYAYIRQLDTHIKGSIGDELFAKYNSQRWVEELTKGKYNTIYYRANKWYFGNKNQNGDKIEMRKEPFCLGFALNIASKYRGIQKDDRIQDIFLDEFIPKNKRYLTNEFSLFQDVLSSIMRDTGNHRVIMCANTIDFNAPYWFGLGVYEIVKYMHAGEKKLVTFRDGDKVQRINLEFTDPPAEGKASDKFFIGNSATAKMITKGEWETGRYPLLPKGIIFRPKEEIFTFYIIVHDEMFKADVILREDKNQYFLYIHKQKEPVENLNNYLVYDSHYHLENNYRRDILRPRVNDTPAKKVYEFFKNDNVFYDDDFTGEMINTYLNMFR